MKKKKRVPYNNTLDADLIKNLRILAAMQDKRHNEVLEEAMQDLIDKYKTNSSRGFQIKAKP